MKLAICIFGEFRNLKLVTDMFIKNMSDVYNPDVFCHTYELTSYQNKPNELNKENLEYFKDKIKPKKIVVEDYNKLDFNKYLELTNDNSKCTVSQIYSRYKANEYRKELGGNYDIVLFTRFDVMWKKVRFSSCKGKKLYLELGLLDYNYYSNMEIANVMCDLLNHLRDYKTFAEGRQLENIFREWTRRNKIGVYNTGYKLLGRGGIIRDVEHELKAIKENNYRHWLQFNCGNICRQSGNLLNY
jgi:hypothetical protein